MNALPCGSQTCHEDSALEQINSDNRRQRIRLPVLADEVSLSTLRRHTGLLSRAWGWLQARQVTRSSIRRLRVAEIVSLGEKRFVAWFRWTVVISFSRRPDEHRAVGSIGCKGCLRRRTQEDPHHSRKADGKT